MDSVPGGRVSHDARPERISGKLLRGHTIGFGKQRWDALSARLVLEPINIALRGELVGGPALVAKKVSNRIVVLTVGQSSQDDTRRPIGGQTEYRDE